MLSTAVLSLKATFSVHGYIPLSIIFVYIFSGFKTKTPHGWSLEHAVGGATGSQH